MKHKGRHAYRTVMVASTTGTYRYGRQQEWIVQKKSRVEDGWVFGNGARVKWIVQDAPKFRQRNEESAASASLTDTMQP